jgi:hypothetical protein
MRKRSMSIERCVSTVFTLTPRTNAISFVFFALGDELKDFALGAVSAFPPPVRS